MNQKRKSILSSEFVKVTNSNVARFPVDRAGVGMVLGGAVLISFSAVFVRLSHVSPTMSGFYRNLIGGLVLAGILIWQRERVRKDRFYIIGGLFCGLVFAADILFFHKQVTPSIALGALMALSAIYLGMTGRK